MTAETDAAHAYVMERVEAERQQLHAQIARHEEQLPTLEAAVDAASAALDAYDLSAATFADGEEEAWDAWRIANERLRSAGQKVVAAQHKLGQLDDPYKIEQRVKDRERIIELRNTHNTKEDGMAAASTAANPRQPKEERTKTFKLVIDAVNDTGNFKDAAAKLNADKVPTLGKSSTGGWTPDTVRSTAFRAQRTEGMDFKVKKQARGRKKAADSPPAEVQKLSQTGKRGSASPKRSTAKRAAAKKQPAKAAAASASQGTAKRSSGKR